MGRPGIPTPNFNRSNPIGKALSDISSAIPRNISLTNGGKTLGFGDQVVLNPSSPKEIVSQDLYSCQYRTSSGTIPGYSVLEIYGYNKDLEVYYVRRPTGDSKSNVIFTNIINEIEYSSAFPTIGMRMNWFKDGIPVKYLISAGTPVIGEEVGTVANQWYVKKGNYGLLVLGYDSTDDGYGRGLVWVRPFSSDLHFSYFGFRFYPTVGTGFPSPYDNGGYLSSVFYFMYRYLPLQAHTLSISPSQAHNQIAYLQNGDTTNNEEDLYALLTDKFLDKFPYECYYAAKNEGLLKAYIPYKDYDSVPVIGSNGEPVKIVIDNTIIAQHKGQKYIGRRLIPYGNSVWPRSDGLSYFELKLSHNGVPLYDSYSETREDSPDSPCCTAACSMLSGDPDSPTVYGKADSTIFFNDLPVSAGDIYTLKVHGYRSMYDDQLNPPSSCPYYPLALTVDLIDFRDLETYPHGRIVASSEPVTIANHGNRQPVEFLITIPEDYTP